MIYGIGCDIEDIDRFYSYLSKENYLKKIYTDSELSSFYNIKNERRKAEFLASRYAVKEAMSKALGTGISKNFSFKDVEVLKDDLGKPYIVYKDFICHVTISHTKTTALAFVVLESKENNSDKR
ncbi:holo-ACP synthase [Gemelliphila palaticanis]|uniref:Holo-[acyl-carrier-protein] synthase n=1 Tax=Gemelliphila palaticanis TaxID=81950 RepID=A0ABX2T0N5_9BACL|nr:holo-ACP synthase [Gemella palaticanis]MBF0716017.1 holo-ACP synthase [Gemella palaticanis]NYS47947.1 holo-ACP synthase [Gemella palaticanis]